MSRQGPGLPEECRKLGGCATGEAKAIGAHGLPVDRVIHAVGPVWRGGKHGEPDRLASCHRRSIELAAKQGCARGAFLAAPVAIRSVNAAMRQHPTVVEARFWLFARRATLGAEKTE